METLRPLAIPPGDYMMPRPSSREDMRSPEFAEKMKIGPGHGAHGDAERAMASHLRKRRVDFPKMTLFVYGHTHEMKNRWPVTLDEGLQVTVFNTGAFQRLVDDKTFTARATAEGMSPEKALEEFSVDRLPACYSAVFVEWRDARPSVELKNWCMEETGIGEGQLVGPCASLCARLNPDCK